MPLGSRSPHVPTLEGKMKTFKLQVHSRSTMRYGPAGEGAGLHITVLRGQCGTGANDLKNPLHPRGMDMEPYYLTGPSLLHSVRG